ncbi:O-antigen translocase [Dryocola sp. LX212]
MKKLLSVTFFSALLTLCRMFSGFIVAKVVAVYIGPSGMSMLGQIQNVMTMLNGLVTSPAGNGVVRYTAQYNKDGYIACSPWWKASLKLILLLLAIVTPLFAVFSRPLSAWLFLNPDYFWIILLCLIALPFSAFGNLLISIINGQQLFKRFIIQSFISVLISCAVMITFVVKLNVEGALIAVALQNGLIGTAIIIGSYKQSWFRWCHFWGGAEKEQYKALSGYILMAITTALCTPIALIIIRKIMVQHLGWDAAGQWQAVWKISETYLSVLTIALSTYYLPKLSAIDDSLLRKEVNKTALLFIPIATVLAMIVYFSKDIIITLLFTKDFSEARGLFGIQLVGDVVKIASWLYAFPMLSRGMTKWFITTELIFSLTFVLLSTLFINIYGLQGANIAYLLNYVIYFCVMFFFLKPIKAINNNA